MFGYKVYHENDDTIVNVEQLVKNLKNFKSSITGILKPRQKPRRDIRTKPFMPQNIYPDEYYPDFILGAAYFIASDLIKSLNETLERYSGPVIDLENVFIKAIIPEKAGIKRYDSNKFIFGNQCNTRNDTCFMFNIIALIQCNTGNDSVKFWNKWKEATLESRRIALRSQVKTTIQPDN
jgi:hypothetical protein